MGTSKAKAKTGRMAVSKYEQESTYKSASKTATKKNVPVKNLPARASKLQVNYKAGSDSEGESDDIVESADAIVPGEADESVQAVKAAGAVEAVQVEKNPIFTVFRSENKLDEGICVIRSLGDGNYELVNLNNAHHSDMAAEKTGEIIKAVPGRRDMLAIPSELWNDVQAKAEIAIKSAGELSQTSDHCSR
jgi:predicted  nucleic acid-binding Zn-ribbon protein